MTYTSKVHRRSSRRSALTSGGARLRSETAEFRARAYRSAMTAKLDSMVQPKVRRVQAASIKQLARDAKRTSIRKRQIWP